MMNLTDFCEIHNVNKENFYVQKHHGKIPNSDISMRGQLTYVNEQYFKRRQNFKRRVWLECHNLYYFLSEGGFGDASIARMVNKISPKHSQNTMQVFISERLFSDIQSLSILVTKIPDLLWAFWRATRWVVMAILKRYGKKITGNLNKTVRGVIYGW